MKRKAESGGAEASARKSVKIEDYCSVQPRQDEDGNPLWPAPETHMNAARKFLEEW
jgi:hypothetical protein